jgi:hypothetical protein
MTALELTNLKQHAVSHLSAAVHDMIDLKPELQDARAIKRADGPLIEVAEATLMVLKRVKLPT